MASPEHDEQVALIEWAGMQRINGRPIVDFLAAIPNGGKRNSFEAYRLKRAGVKAGVSDLILAYPVAHYHGMWIEMKARDNGRLTPEQRDWIDLMQSVGYHAGCYRGFDEARVAIERYLALAGRVYLNGSH